MGNIEIMMNFTAPLTKENFLLYAAKEYNNPQCLGVTEFNSDLKRFMYIKRLLKRHLRGSDTDFRLLLNHILIINNLFNPKATCRMLFFYCNTQTWPVLVAICTFLNIYVEDIPETRVYNVVGCDETFQILKEL